MRIVGGASRGAKLEAPEDGSIRPTADRTREAVFNILSHGRFGEAPPYRDAVVLDAFCGTGAMGLEALSRGAGHLVLMDKDPAAITVAGRNVTRLGAAGRCEIIRADATKPPRARRAASLIFLDPPYREDLAVSALAALDAAGWIAAGAVVVVETDLRDPLEAPAGFTLIDDRRQGRARLRILLRADRD